MFHPKRNTHCNYHPSFLSYSTTWTWCREQDHVHYHLPEEVVLMIMTMTEWVQRVEDPLQMQVYDNTGWVPDVEVANQRQPRTGTQEGLEFLSYSSEKAECAIWLQQVKHVVRQEIRYMNIQQETRISVIKNNEMEMFMTKKEKEQSRFVHLLAKRGMQFCSVLPTLTKIWGKKSPIQTCFSHSLSFHHSYGC